MSGSRIGVEYVPTVLEKCYPVKLVGNAHYMVNKTKDGNVYRLTLEGSSMTVCRFILR